MDGSRGRREGGENLTKKTVAAVRQLCVDGRITIQQKQKLIFSVIRSTKAEDTRCFCESLNPVNSSME